MNPDLYFEDLKVGDRFQTGSLTVTEEVMLAFARVYDPQPMHADPEAAASGPFHGLIGSGWHTAALVMKLTAEARPWGNTPLLGLGVKEIQWPQPVRPGDTLQVEIEVLALRASKSRPDYGIAALQSTARNQKGETVYQMQPSCWVPRRPR